MADIMQGVGVIAYINGVVENYKQLSEKFTPYITGLSAIEQCLFMLINLRPHAVVGKLDLIFRKSTRYMTVSQDFQPLNHTFSG